MCKLIWGISKCTKVRRPCLADNFSAGVGTVGSDRRWLGSCLARSLAGAAAAEAPEAVPQLKQLRGGEEDGVEGLHHQPGKLEVGLGQKKLGEAAVNVLGAKEDAQLPGRRKRKLKK